MTSLMKTFSRCKEFSVTFSFTPVFKRNMLFSKKKPGPDLGERHWSLADCERFYKFWNNFETWREFSQYYEYDVREASDRYEKRWMEKENKKIIKDYVKAERVRLIKLVDLAYELYDKVFNP
jgi:DnaJ family protein C protein 2